jgi:outer membrane protein assembly factor BamB
MNMSIGVGIKIGFVKWLVILFMIILIASSKPLASSDSWPTFFGNPQHTGNSSSPVPDTNVTLWTAPTSVGGNGYTSPAIADGKVFVTRGIRITCLYLENGTEIWNQFIQPATTASSSPTVVDDRVYVTGQNLYCFYANNGTNIWVIPLTGEPGTSSPTVVDGKVYVNTQTLWCYDANDGSEIWNVSVGGNGYSTPAVANGKVFVNGDDLICFYGNNGTEIWRAPGGNGTSPVIANGKVFIKPSELRVVYENNGTEVWTKPYGIEGYSTPAVANGRIYAHIYDDADFEYKLVCIYESDGGYIWDFPLYSEGCSSPAVSGDGKVVITEIDRTYCLDAITGSEIWRYDTGGPGYSTPAIANGRVIVNQAVVYCFGEPLTVDSIILVDDEQNELTTFAMTFGQSVPIYAAGYNSSANTFIKFVEVEWTESDGLGSFNPSIGTSTIYTAGSTMGTTTITGDNTTMTLSDDFIVEIRMSTVLKQGWNLISIPLLQGDQDLTKVLESIDGYYDAVQWYDSTEKGDPWKHNKIGKSFGNDLFELNETKGFWVHITQPGDTVFLFNGTIPTENQTITLNPGWNLVGYPSLINRDRTDALNNLTFGTQVDSVWSYNSTTQKWNEMTGSDYFEVGRGYYIHSLDFEIWEVPL